MSMVGIYLGDTPPEKIFVGTTEVASVWVGTEKVWPMTIPMGIQSGSDYNYPAVSSWIQIVDAEAVPGYPDTVITGGGMDLPAGTYTFWYYASAYYESANRFMRLTESGNAITSSTVIDSKSHVVVYTTHGGTVSMEFMSSSGSIYIYAGDAWVTADPAA